MTRNPHAFVAWAGVGLWIIVSCWPRAARAEPREEVNAEESAAGEPSKPVEVTAATSRPAEAESAAFDPLGIALLSVAIAGVSVGAGTGIASLERLHFIEQNCEGNHCSSSDAGAGKAAERLALVSTVAFAVGGVALGAYSLRVWVLPLVQSSRSSSGEGTGLRISGEF